MPAPKWKSKSPLSHRPDRARPARPALFGIAAVLTSFASVGAAASPCLPGDAERIGRATATDGRTLRLPAGRQIRLLGLEPLLSDAPARQTARDALAKLTDGRDLLLYGARPADRYNRIPGMVLAEGESAALQEQLLRSGDAALGEVADEACLTRLRQLETEARDARRGIWAHQSAIKNTETPADILAMMGRFVVAEGKVASARQSGATLYVNFGPRWTRDFAVTIGRRDRQAFEKAGLSRLALEGRRVRVRGWVTERRGSPRIHATGPWQIEILR